MEILSEAEMTGLFELAVRDAGETEVETRSGGMTGRDVLVLLKVAAGWRGGAAELARELGLTAARTCLALERGRRVGLLDADKRLVQREALVEFFAHGLRFTLPADVRGGRTAPMDPAASAAAEGDERLGALLDLADIMRRDGPRERAAAARELARRLSAYSFS
ncbi:MAG: hypothetical protein HKL90_04800 [Elusimicrobia bacterium]|nr:hypothetical protein [Elusimicrobiota bacterium]